LQQKPNRNTAKTFPSFTEFGTMLVQNIYMYIAKEAANVMPCIGMHIDLVASIRSIEGGFLE
jgi:uncharacterized membrane protein